MVCNVDGMRNVGGKISLGLGSIIITPSIKNSTVCARLHVYFKQMVCSLPLWNEHELEGLVFEHVVRSRHNRKRARAGVLMILPQMC